MFFLGIAAFLMFFLGDYNDWRLKNRLLRSCFYVGIVMLAAATAGLCIQYDSSPLTGRFRLLFGFFSLVFGSLTLYAVLSVSFMGGGSEKNVYTGKLYALCRHPGFLFFVPLYICLWLSAGFPLYAAAVYCGLNLMLILFEDMFVFPAFLQGYNEYKQTTPFIIPGITTIRRLLSYNSKGGII